MPFLAIIAEVAVAAASTIAEGATAVYGALAPVASAVAPYAQVGLQVGNMVYTGVSGSAQTAQEEKALKVQEKLTELQTQAVQEKARYEKELLSRKGQAVLSGQRAMGGFAGVTQESIEPIQLETARNIALDSSMISRNALWDVLALQGKQGVEGAKSNARVSALNNATWGSVLTGATNALGTAIKSFAPAPSATPAATPSAPYSFSSDESRRAIMGPSADDLMWDEYRRRGISFQLNG